MTDLMFKFFNSIEEITDAMINCTRVIETDKTKLRFSQTGKTFLKYRNGTVPDELKYKGTTKTESEARAILATDEWNWEDE